MNKNNLVTKDMITIAKNDAFDLSMKNEACERMHNFSVQYTQPAATPEKYPYAFRMVSLIENGITEADLENWLINEWWK